MLFWNLPGWRGPEGKEAPSSGRQRTGPPQRKCIPPPPGTRRDKNLGLPLSGSQSLALPRLGAQLPHRVWKSKKGCSKAPVTPAPPGPTLHTEGLGTGLGAVRAVGLTGLQATEQQQEKTSTGREPERQVSPAPSRRRRLLLTGRSRLHPSQKSERIH